jgi:hypothetical protein
VNAENPDCFHENVLPPLPFAVIPALLCFAIGAIQMVITGPGRVGEAACRRP